MGFIAVLVNYRGLFAWFPASIAVSCRHRHGQQGWKERHWYMCVYHVKVNVHSLIKCMCLRVKWGILLSVMMSFNVFVAYIIRFFSINIHLDIFRDMFSTHFSTQPLLWQANKDFCTLAASPDVKSERGGWGTSQSHPQWYIRPLQCSVALKSTALTFQLRSNYIHVLG